MIKLPLVGAFLAGIAALAAMWILQAPGHSLAIDRAAFRLLSLSPSATIMRDGPDVITDGGDLLVLGVVLIAIYLLHGARWVASATVGVGYPVVLLSAHVLKEIAQRPRPTHEVLYAGGYGFPSSDAALSVGFVAIAIIAARSLDDARRRRSSYVVGITLSLLVGVLVIALRDHYLTDVIAGWGLGAAVFSGTTLVALAAEETLAARRAGGPLTDRARGQSVDSGE